MEKSLRIELLGIPGVGKTTNLKKIVKEIKRYNYNCYLKETFFDSFTKRKLIYLKEFISSPFFYFKLFYYNIRYKYYYPYNGVKSFLVYNSIYKTFEKKRGVIFFDDIGVFQRVLSFFVYSKIPGTKYNDFIKFIFKHCKLPDVVVLFCNTREIKKRILNRRQRIRMVNFFKDKDIDHYIKKNQNALAFLETKIIETDINLIFVREDNYREVIDFILMNNYQ